MAQPEVIDHEMLYNNIIARIAIAMNTCRELKFFSSALGTPNFESYIEDVQMAVERLSTACQRGRDPPSAPAPPPLPPASKFEKVTGTPQSTDDARSRTLNAIKRRNFTLTKSEQSIETPSITVPTLLTSPRDWINPLEKIVIRRRAIEGEDWQYDDDERHDAEFHLTPVKDRQFVIDTFLSVVKSESQPVDVVRVLLEVTDISLVNDVCIRKLLLFLKRHMRHKMFNTLCCHLSREGHDMRSILMGEKWTKTDVLTMLNDPETYNHHDMLVACINAGDVGGAEMILRESLTLDLAANDFKALRKAIEFNDLEITKLIVRHPSFDSNGVKFCQEMSQNILSIIDPRTDPRMNFLNELNKELDIDIRS